MTGLEDAGEHPVVQGGDGARVLALDGREESLDVMVRAGRDSSDALVGFENDDRHLGDTGLDESVDITDGTSPIVEAAKAAVPGDLHHRP